MSYPIRGRRHAPRGTHDPAAAAGYADLVAGAMRQELRITLPWPPSVNRYWRHVGARVLLSENGRKYRQHVADLVMVARCSGRFSADQRLMVDITANPPDRRRRDLDNIPKALLDALEAAGVMPDDEQIDSMTIVRGAVLKGGRTYVWMREIQEERNDG